MAADSLSRLFENGGEQAQYQALTVTIPLWIQELGKTWEIDEELQSIISQLIVNLAGVVGYSWDNGKLKFEGKLVV